MGDNLARQHFVGMNHLNVLQKKKQFAGWDAEAFKADTDMMLGHISSLEHKSGFDLEAEAFIRQKWSVAQQYPVRFEDLDLRNEYIIHGDFHQYNVFFSDEDTVSHVFDFERVMRGPRAVDVIYSLFLTCFNFEEPYTALEEEYALAESFLKGYHKAYPLLRKELEDAITWYFLGELTRTHWIEGERYFGNNPRVEALLPERRARFNYMADNFDHIKERLVGCLFPE
jgi:Ser/Thr protein kinase RdoA (MazF antagonist)